MKRFLQLLGEMKSYRLPTAKRALQELIVEDELVIVVPEQSLAAEIQQWATSQGFTVAAPKKMLDGLARFQLSVKKAVPAPAVEAKPATAAPAPAAAPAASSASTPATPPAAPAAPAPTASSTTPTTPAPVAAPVSAAVPATSEAPTPAAPAAPADGA